MSETAAVKSTLAQKLIEVMHEVQSVEKRGKNEDQGYSYVKAADVAIPVRAALIKRNVLILPSVKSQTFWEMPTKSGTMRRGVDLVVEYTLLDAESGEKLVADGYGSGLDSGDRYSYKAHTGAWKYFVRMLFMLPDEQGDPEFERAEKKTYGDTAKSFPTSGTVQNVAIVQIKDGVNEVHALCGNDLGKFIAKAVTEPEMSRLLDTEGEHIDFICWDTLTTSEKSGVPIFRVVKVNPTHAELMEITKGVKPEPAEPAKRGRK